MKILHIVPTYYPAFARGGPIWSVHNLNKYLVKAGVDVTVYTTNLDVSKETPCNKKVIVDGVKVWYFPVSFRPWQYSREMHRALRENMKNFDIVHVTSVFLSASTLGARYAKKFGKPYLISPRGSLMREPVMRRHRLAKMLYLRLVEKRNLEQSDAIHFTVPMEREEYEGLGLPLRRALVIPNGIEPDELNAPERPGAFREKFGIPKGKRIILSLGRIDWKKGFDTLIPAFAALLKRIPEAFLVIAGEGGKGYTEEVKAMVSREGIKDKALFTGLLTGQDKAAALNEAEIFTLPSYAENFGMAVAEAMYAGLPVVITEGVGIASDVQEAGAGIVIQKDEQTLTDALAKVMANDAERKAMGERGRALVKEKFIMPKITNTWIAAYNKLTS